MKILLLPGLDGTGMLFDPFRQLLPVSLASHVCTLPSTGNQTPDFLAQHIATTAGCDEEVVVVAESYSGPIAYQLLQRQIHNIVGLVLVASFFTLPHPLLRVASWLPIQLFPLNWSPRWALRWFCVGKSAPDHLVRSVQQAIASVPVPIIAERMRVLADLEEPKDKIHVPCLYLQPTHDRLVSKSHAASLTNWCSDLTVQQIVGPHFLLQANPRDCLDAVIKFVDKLPKAEL